MDYYNQRRKQKNQSYTNRDLLATSNDGSGDDRLGWEKKKAVVTIKNNNEFDYVDLLML